FSVFTFSLFVSVAVSFPHEARSSAAVILNVNIVIFFIIPLHNTVLFILLNYTTIFKKSDP
ncbi:hypothetical protein NT06LI_2666, partial [Listeria innocua FSL J1-023]